MTAKKASKNKSAKKQKNEAKESTNQKQQPKTLGKKYTCFKCGTKFYDLGRPEPICPKCGANQKDAPQTATTKASKKVRKTKSTKTPQLDEIIDIIEKEHADDEDIFIEDVEELNYDTDSGLDIDDEEEEF